MRLFCADAFILSVISYLGVSEQITIFLYYLWDEQMKYIRSAERGG